MRCAELIFWGESGNYEVRALSIPSWVISVQLCVGDHEGASSLTPPISIDPPSPHRATVTSPEKKPGD